MGNLDRGLRQLEGLWAHPDFLQRLSDGASHDRFPLHDELRRAVLARDGYACGSCFYHPSHEPLDMMPLQVDHLVPVAAGGTDYSTNLRTLCEACNELKSNLFTADVRSTRPRQIVAYCLTDVDSDEDAYCNQMAFRAYCRRLCSVDGAHAAKFELSTYLAVEPAFTDMYTQQLLGIGRSPQLTRDASAEAQDRWRQLFDDAREAARRRRQANGWWAQ